MERKRREARNITIAITHGGSPHIDDLISISLLSYFYIYNFGNPIYVIRNSDINEIIKKIKNLKDKYILNNIFILDQTLEIEKLKEEFKNIEIETIDHHNISTNDCTFQLLLEYLYPEYSLKLLDYDFDIGINFNDFEIYKTFKPINYINKLLKLLSIADTNGPFEAFKFYKNTDNIENIEELLEFEYFILKNPINYSIIKFFQKKKSFLISSKSNIFYIIGEIIINQLFINKKIKDLEFEKINNNLIIVKSKKRYIDSHILKYTLDHFNLEINENLKIIYFKNSSRNKEEYSMHLISISNKKFNIEKLKKLINLRFIHGNNKIIAIEKKDYEKFIEILENETDIII